MAYVDTGTLANTEGALDTQALPAGRDSELAGFPTVERTPDGSWNYWVVQDTGDRIADYARGSLLAMETCVYLAGHTGQTGIIWKILDALPPHSPTAFGFKACLERLFVAFGTSFKTG